MGVLIVGSVALDSVKTPLGSARNVLGGSACYASLSASFFNGVRLVGVVGKDFPKKHLDSLRSRRVDMQGLKVENGKTFRWEGFYDDGMNQAHTIATQLNVFSEFQPELPHAYKNSSLVFLANIDPEIQLNVLSQIKSPELVLADTMNFWIEKKKEALLEVVKKVDIFLLNDAEACQLMGEKNLAKAARKILELGAKYVLIKKGEHGALLFWMKKNKKLGIFFCPSFPLEVVKDPTGAGDSFAGGLLGFIARNKQSDFQSIKTAMLAGTSCASFCIEEFSIKGLMKASRQEVLKRVAFLKEMITF